MGDIIKCHKCNCFRIICEDINYVCPKCGDCIIHSFYVPAYSDTSQYYLVPRKSVYKRTAYFESLIHNLQARTFVKISDETLNEIKENMNCNTDINSLKRVLKKMKLTQYYKYLYYILEQLYGKTHEPLTINEERKLIKLFKQLQDSFEKNKPDSRDNFINYNFVLYKLLPQIGRADLCEFVPLPKNKHLLKKHELLWQQINNL